MKTNVKKIKMKRFNALTNIHTLKCDLIQKLIHN